MIGATGRSANQSDGYLVAGDDYDFTLFNPGLTAWRSFTVVAPAGTSFVGGTTGNEASATCVVGPPDQITCGPLSPSTVPAGGGVSFVATTTSTATCAPTFALSVSTDGTTYVHAADLAALAACGMQPPQVAPRLSLSGTARVGAVLRVAAVRWSAQPTRVTYRWERCTRASCTTIARATGSALRLTRADAGRTVRVTVTATVGAQRVRVRSPGLLVRPAAKR